jgi:hypothetical protein
MAEHSATRRTVLIAGKPASGRITIVNAPAHLRQVIEMAGLRHPQVAIEP